MAYKKYRAYNTDIHVYIQEDDEYISLLHIPYGEMRPLSKIVPQDPAVITSAKINCSYFNGIVTLGRNQGELLRGTLDQKAGYPRYDYVIKGTNHMVDTFQSWDHVENTTVGFSPAVVLIKNGSDVTLVSTEITTTTKYTARNPQTIFGQFSNGKAFMLVSEGRNNNDVGLTGAEVRTFVKTLGTVKHCVMLDGGGSSEMIVNNVIVNYLSDGSERRMCNGLAFLKKVEKKMDYHTINCDGAALVIRTQPNLNGSIIGKINEGESQTFENMMFVPGRTSMDPSTGIKYQVLEVWGSWIYKNITYTHGFIQYDSGVYWIGD